MNCVTQKWKSEIKECQVCGFRSIPLRTGEAQYLPRHNCVDHEYEKTFDRLTKRIKSRNDDFLVNSLSKIILEPKRKFKRP